MIMETQSSASTSANVIPYQPYRSKRHSRSISANFNATIAPEPSEGNNVLQTSSYINGRIDKAKMAPKALPEVQVHTDKTVAQQPIVEVEVTSASAVVDSPAVTAITQPTTTSSGISTEYPNTPPVAPLDSSSITPPVMTETLTPSPPAPKPSAGPITPPVASSSKYPLLPSSKPTSTFRRISPSTRAAPHTPPLSRPNSVLSLTPSGTSTLRNLNSPSQAKVTPQQNVHTPSPIHNTQVIASSTLSDAPRPSPSPSKGPIQDTHISPFSSVNGTPSASPTPVSTPSTPPVSQSVSRVVSPSPSTISRRPIAPYRPGFQPRGHYRHRTDEFIAARSTLRDKDKIEQRRLERRLEKLIALHFSPTCSAKSTPAVSEKTGLSFPSTSRASLFFDIDFGKNPAELLKDVVSGSGGKANIRAEEQRITPWQNDKDVSECPICITSFNTLTNRKHHCRLCGRIVCSLPIKLPTRKQLCSILFIVDQKTGKIEEVGEGVDYGVKRKEGEEEKFLKGVRICKDCKSILARQQYLQEVRSTPTFVRLYEALIQLEKEIETTLPQFQELILVLTTTPSPDAPSLSPNDHALHKRLLESFASYDQLAKRIRQLPAPRSSSQERIQQAIATRAGAFLSGRIGILKAFPSDKPSRNLSEPTQPSTVSKDALSADAMLAQTLQPLLEQETLLESFVAEAKAQRKFEDAKTLKASLEEIRGEIARIVREAGG